MNVKLKEARAKLGFTQAQVSSISCVSERAYQNYELELREPGVQAAIRIAKILHTTVESLWGKE